eukprot:scaffold12153_cov167-Amphora_coffeaeformis.AAC.5
MKSVSFVDARPTVYSYSAPNQEEYKLYYPDMTEKQMLLEYRKQVMNGYRKGSARFKDSVEKLYAGARKNYNEAELSSGEFTLDSLQDKGDNHVGKVSASDIRGLEEIYCSAIADHRGWAIRQVIASQRDKALRKRLPDIAATVSTRSKNFARLVALGDAEEARKVSTAHAA